MADISKIKLPNNNEYDIKDSTARSQLGNKISEPATEGTAGQVLTTDGNGGRSWTTVSGGGGDGYQLVSTSDGNGNVVLSVTGLIDGNNMNF